MFAMFATLTLEVLALQILQILQIFKILQCVLTRPVSLTQARHDTDGRILKEVFNDDHLVTTEDALHC